MVAVAVLAMASAAASQPVHARSSQAAAPAAASNFTVSSTGNAGQPNQINPQTRRSTLRWDSVRGRWGLQVDMDQSGQRDMNWSDVQAGAYYSVTRGLRVGGAVSLGDNSMSLQPRNAPIPQAPRVRLETAFRF
jgi:hypothetical protein